MGGQWPPAFDMFKSFDYDETSQQNIVVSGAQGLLTLMALISLIRLPTINYLLPVLIRP